MSFQAVGSGLSIVACSTCRLSPEQRGEGDGRGGGALFGQLLTAVRDSDPRYAGIDVQAMPCLFACGEPVAVHLRAAGKFSYVLGRFAPDEESARAILDYALLYADSDMGSVRYADWPQGVKGHFLTRSPPEGHILP
jgi:predicted metal-binding protein